MTDFDKLLHTIEGDNPDDWLMVFEGRGEVELEWFNESYMGDKEVGCGNKTFSGTLPAVIRQIREWMNNGKRS
jgi:hypothetical protein